MHRLSPLDTGFLIGESRETPMAVGVNPATSAGTMTTLQMLHALAMPILTPKRANPASYVSCY